MIRLALQLRVLQLPQSTSIVRAGLVDLMTREEAPRFQELPDEESYFNFSSRENTDISITATESTNNLDDFRLHRAYQCCHIIMNECELSSLFGFGFGAIYGSGGVLFATLSSVVIYKSNFFDNQATCGGSLSLYSSDLLCEGGSFNHDVAYYQAGALSCMSLKIDVPEPQNTRTDLDDQEEPDIYMFPSDDEDDSPYHTRSVRVQIIGTTFTECVSKEFFGAAAFMNIPDLYIESCQFTQNIAFHSGGALGIRDSMAYIAKSVFSDNRVAMKWDFQTGETSLRKMKFRYISIPRGGGAILTFNYYQPQKWWLHISKIELFTHDCCFVNNVIQENIYDSFTAEKTAELEKIPLQKGTDILFSGESYYRSLNDVFSNSQIDAINHTAKAINPTKPPNADDILLVQKLIFSQSGTVFHGDAGSYEKCTDIGWSVTEIPELPTREYKGTDTLSIDSTTTISTQTHPAETSEPTTPMTRLPYKTTSSRSATELTTKFTFSSTISKAQSMTPTLSMSPTASTGFSEERQPEPTECDSCEFTTIFPFAHSPTASEGITVTSKGASWPDQSSSYIGTPTASTGGAFPIGTISQTHYGESPHPQQTTSISFQDQPSHSSSYTKSSVGASWPDQSSSYVGTPTASTGDGYPLLSVTPSRFGESPNPPPTTSVSFLQEPSRSSSYTKTSKAASWPAQSESYVGTPTASTGDGYPLKSVTPTAWGESPNPPPTTSVSFLDQPSHSSSYTKTSKAASWPAQSDSYMGTPTASTGDGYPMRSVTPSAWGESPNPPHTATSSFQDRPSHSSSYTKSSAGASWPSQTSSYIGTPTASTGDGYPLHTVTPSHYGESPNPAPTTSVSFQEQPSHSSSFTTTSKGASWPAQTSSYVGTPTASTGGGIPVVTVTESHFGEKPNPEPTSSVSFMKDPSRSSPHTKTVPGAKWPAQTTSYLGTPTASTGGEYPHFSPSSQSQSHYGESPLPPSTLSMSFHGQPMQSSSHTATVKGAVWPAQTVSYRGSPTASTGKGIPPPSPRSISESAYGESPLPVATISISFFGDPMQSSSHTQTKPGAVWPAQSYISRGTPTCSTGDGKPPVSVTQSHFGEAPFPIASRSISFLGDPSHSSSYTLTSAGASWPSQTFFYRGTPTASTWNEIPQATDKVRTQSHYGESPNPPQTASISWQDEPRQSSSHSATSPGYDWPAQTYTLPPTRQVSRSKQGEIPLGTESSATPSHHGEIPNPTPTVSISFQGEEPNPSETPTESIPPTPSQTAEEASVSLSQTISFYVSQSWGDSLVDSVMTVTLTAGVIETLSYSSGVPIWIETMTYVEQEITTFVITSGYVPHEFSTETNIDIIIISQASEKKKPFPLWLIIVIAVGGILLISVIGVAIWMFFPRAGQESSSDHSGEMVEETIVQINESSTAPVTQDNPLWTSNVMDNTDDPFRDDFEEDTNAIITTTTAMI